MKKDRQNLYENECLTGEVMFGKKMHLYRLYFKDL